MAEVKSVQPRGSIVLKLLIVAFFALLLVSILTPQSEWKAQENKRDQCRLQMENLSYVVREYGMRHLGYVDNLDEYLAFIEVDTVEMRPGRYEMESLTRDPESGKDSLLLDFTDDFHLSRFEYKTLRNQTVLGDSIVTDSVHVYAVPRSQFTNIPVTTVVLTSKSPITVEYREKNINDHAVLIYSESQINYDWITPDPVPLKSTEALISIPADQLNACATSNDPYKLNVNVRSVLEGTVDFLVNKEEIEYNVTQDSLMVDLFNHRLKTEALAEVLLIIKQDSSLIDMKDSILVEKFVERLSKIKNKETFQVTGDHTINVPADSMTNWNDSLRIKRAVFVAHVDTLSQTLKSVDEFMSLIDRISYQENYKIAKIDTVGVTIQCPLDSSYVDTDKSFLQKIFGVSSPENHGEVANGDLSWSEKK